MAGDARAPCAEEEDDALPPAASASPPQLRSMPSSVLTPVKGFPPGVKRARRAILEVVAPTKN